MYTRQQTLGYSCKPNKQKMFTFISKGKLLIIISWVKELQSYELFCKKNIFVRILENLFENCFLFPLCYCS